MAHHDNNDSAERVRARRPYRMVRDKLSSDLQGELAYEIAKTFKIEPEVIDDKKARLIEKAAMFIEKAVDRLEEVNSG
jgi:hypothetical protein